MTQTALDRVIDSALQEWRLQASFNEIGWFKIFTPFDKMLGASMIRHGSGRSRTVIKSDPRYIAYCKEQDRQAAVSVLQVVHHQGYREEWLSDGRVMAHKDHCEGEQTGVFDVDCALAGLGWNYPPGAFKKEQDREPTFRNTPNVGTFLSDPGDRPLKTRGKTTYDESLGDLGEEKPLDLREINRRLAGHNPPLKGDTSTGSGPPIVMTKSQHTITV